MEGWETIRLGRRSHISKEKHSKEKRSKEKRSKEKHPKEKHSQISKKTQILTTTQSKSNKKIG